MINWVLATKAHKLALRSFTCADPNGFKYDPLLRKKVHSEPWALEVQSALREWRFRRNGNRVLWLGINDEGQIQCAVVLRYPDRQQFDEEGSAEFSAAPPMYYVDLIAVGFQERGKGLADPTYGQALALASSDFDDLRAAGDTKSDGFMVAAVIHHKNDRARSFFGRFGMSLQSQIRAEYKNPKGKRLPAQAYELWAVLYQP